VLEPKNNISGVVEFHQCSEYEPVNIRMRIFGIGNRTHAIHIHEYGDLRTGCVGLGGHFNPYGQTHGSKDYHMPRHAGDLTNNITFNAQGYFNYEYRDHLLSLFNSQNNDELTFVGRSIVIHEQQDDLGFGNNEESLISGNAGKRLNCGIIGICRLEHF
jgi:Cu-Zn family superoxide dismutase